MAEQVMSAGSPENIVGVISKLLTDLVARNDQVGRAPYAHAVILCPAPVGDLTLARGRAKVRIHAPCPSADKTNKKERSRCARARGSCPWRRRK